ncbi:osm1, partial [Symbiodinium sp. CCMP2456]
ASFQKRAKKTGEVDASPSSPDSPDSPKVELWTRLKDLLELDRISPEEESPEILEEVLHSLGPAWQETLERCNSRRSSKAESFLSGEDELKAALREEERELRARKAQERAMEIDIEAKEALVGRLMEQREELKMKTQELTKQLEQGVAERWFCGCLQGVSSLFSRK